VNWYALHVQSCQERTVALKLERSAIESFYPHILKKSKDKRRDIEQKFMPGYVFAHFRLEERGPIVAIPQVVRILGWGNHAAAIPDSEVAAVRQILSFPKLVMPSDFFTAGQRVRVKYGPLVGLEGLIVQRKKHCRIVVSIETVGRSIAAEVDADSLEFLAPAQQAA
jgi:transcription antitermination factor NusG